MAHWEYLFWALASPVGVATAWKYLLRAFLMIVGGMTKDPQRSKQCAEMLRLHLKDAKDMPSYLADVREPNEPAIAIAPPARKRRRHRTCGGSHKIQPPPPSSSPGHQLQLSANQTAGRSVLW